MDGTIGEIRLFAGNFAPLNWMMCDGSLQSISEYSATYTILGTTYGGDGQTTFGLPDLRGRIPLHVGQGRGLDRISAGQMGGEEMHTLLTSEIPGHGHGVSLNSATITMKVSSKPPTTDTPVANSSLSCRANSTGSIKEFTNAAPNVALGVGLGDIPVPNGVAGSSMPHENMQPFLALNYIICMIGVYPSRP